VKTIIIFLGIIVLLIVFALGLISLVNALICPFDDDEEFYQEEIAASTKFQD
jgi:hypothetical protein